jgi:DNA-directed RNA polymerase specialized sigma subunit
MSANKTPAKKANKQYTKQKQVVTSTEDVAIVGKSELVDYLPLVKYIAGRLAIGLPRSVEMDDLINAGVVGLIDAYNNFDGSKGVKFETYASLRVRGSILDELRGMDWVPRSTRAPPARLSARSLSWRVCWGARRRKPNWPMN